MRYRQIPTKWFNQYIANDKKMPWCADTRKKRSVLNMTGSLAQHYKCQRNYTCVNTFALIDIYFHETQCNQLVKLINNVADSPIIPQANWSANFADWRNLYLYKIHISFESLQSQHPSHGDLPCIRFISISSWFLNISMQDIVLISVFGDL